MIKITSTFKAFFQSEKTGGFLLIGCTLFSIIITNSCFGGQYQNTWATLLCNHTLTEWINDALMSIFFLLIGLELEREIYAGELSSIKTASLPIIAAIGGVIVPASIYACFNFNTPYLSGTGIPMATDIAFAIGILSLLGNKVPVGLKVFLTALAVIDDLLAILVIAVFYTNTISSWYLFLSALIFVMLLLMNKMKINMLLPYLIGGILLWICMFHSGIHPTLSGVLLAFAIPFGKGDNKSISYKLQHALHYPVAFFIIPIFALANTCIVFTSNFSESMLHPINLGIIFGLLVGKPFGIMLFSKMSIKLKICSLPEDVNFKHLLGGGILAGIGFTMSIFICVLSFNNQEWINNAKMSVLIASSIAGIVGGITLNRINQIKSDPNKPPLRHNHTNDGIDLRKISRNCDNEDVHEAHFLKSPLLFRE